MTHDPSDSERDEPLGRALRQALEPAGDAEAFTARVLARFERPRARAWDTLASWSRLGVVTAAAVALAAIAVLSLRGRTDVSIATTLAASNTDEVAQLMTEDDSPGTDVLFTVANEDD
jgi:hypothetical protein